MRYPRATRRSLRFGWRHVSASTLIFPGKTPHLLRRTGEEHVSTPASLTRAGVRDG
jgi:hypothetical protein